MNKTIFILLIILSIILVSILAYLIYDYVKYKQNVDIAFGATIDQVNTQFNRSNKNIKIHNKSINQDFSNSKNSYNIQQYKHSLNNYFEFGQDNLDLKTHIKLNNGLDLTTSNANDLNICNSRDECIRFRSDQQKFSIIPNNVRMMTIYAENETPLAAFDMSVKGIYLGGTNESTSPLYVRDDEVYINHMNVKDISSTLDYMDTLPP
jgi:hypothetical protein